MAKRAYAKRYAQAAFRIALERQELDKWQSDLNQIASLGSDAVLKALMDNPRLHFDDKVKVLAERLGNVSPMASNLVYMLVARGRFNLVAEIAEDYQRLYDIRRGVEPAEVVTAVPLDESEKARLAERLEAIIGKKVVVKHEVDPGLLGGIVARVGGKLLDGSTRSRLEALKEQLGGERR